MNNSISLIEQSQIDTIIAINQSNINDEVIQTVNARELHSFLGVETRFNDWLDRRVKEYGFVDGVDFYSNLSKTSNSGRPSKE